MFDCCESGWLTIAVTWDVFGSRLRMILAVGYQHLCLKSVSRRQINLGRNLSQSVTVMRVTSLPSAVFSRSLVAAAIYMVVSVVQTPLSTVSITLLVMVIPAQTGSFNIHSAPCQRRLRTE